MICECDECGSITTGSLPPGAYTNRDGETCVERCPSCEEVLADVMLEAQAREPSSMYPARPKRRF